MLLAPAASGVSYVRETLERPLAILSAVVFALLLLACFLVANLLLARATARQKEIAVRIALGASRSRILRQLAMESLVMALAGAAAGLLLAHSLSGALLRASSSELRRVELDLSFDWTVFGFAAGAAVLSAMLFGLAPALRAAHITPADAFKSGSATVPSSVMRIRSLLLAGQIALAVVLTTGAVLFGATLRNLLSVETGFDSEHHCVSRTSTCAAHTLRRMLARRSTTNCWTGFKPCRSSSRQASRT